MLACLRLSSQAPSIKFSIMNSKIFEYSKERLLEAPRFSLQYHLSTPIGKTPNVPIFGADSLADVQASIMSESEK